MQLILSEFAGLSENHNQEAADKIGQALNRVIENYTDDFVQDMSHISQAANYAGNIAVDKVEYLKDDLYRCDYSYDWAIAWTCSGTQEAGRVKEKVRFTLSENGELIFKFLKLDL